MATWEQAYKKIIHNDFIINFIENISLKITQTK
jgi:hypothetical protein